MSELQSQLSIGSPEQPPAYRCLEPLLNVLNWPGSPRHLSEVLPDSQTIPDFAALRDVLGHLHYRTIPFEDGSRLLTAETLPALLTAPDGDIWVILEIEQPGQFKVYKGRQARLATVFANNLSGKIHLVRHIHEEETENEEGRFGWISSIFEKEKKLIRMLVWMSFAVNCLALLLPVYMLTVYDLAIGANSMPTLITLAGVIAIVIAAEMMLRELRARSIARVAVRMHMWIMEAVFDRITRLSVSLVENASLTGQMNKLRAFESLREIFSGPLVVSLLDLPFILIFIAAVFVIGGWLGWLLVGFICALTILSATFISKERVKARKASIRRSETRQFRKDMNSNLPVIQCCAAEEIWEKRYSGYIARQLTAETQTQRLSFTEQTLAQSFSTMTGALIIGMGTLGVISGDLSIGALVAIMAIVWRVLAPVQSVLLNVNRLFQAIDTVKQLNQLMKLPREFSRISTPPDKKIAGRIELENVAYRKPGEMLPSLRSISLTMEPGELVVLSGPRGPSRSTLLRLIANVYQPVSGRIRIDGFDARQYDARMLRQRIALVSNDQILFPGSLAYNFWLVNPLADRNMIQNALKDADLENFVAELDGGLDADLTDYLRSGLNAGIYQKIRLARAYIQDPDIYLFDEPVRDLNPSGHRAFVDKLFKIKGKATAIIRTSDYDICRLADKIAHLHTGQIVRLDVNKPGTTSEATKALRSLLKMQPKEPGKRPLSA